MFSDLVGIPFRNGGRDTSGLDCWGLAMMIYGRYGITLPDFVIDSFACNVIENTAWEEVSERRWEQAFVVDNDHVPLLVLIRNNPRFVNHVGVYIGDGQLIHTNADSGVVIAHITGHLESRIEGYYRRV